MAKKKVSKCTECVHCFNNECNHPSNKGIELHARREIERYIKPISELNNGDCKNYEKSKLLKD